MDGLKTKNQAISAIVAEVAALLRAADSALFVTGAGISADSGLPTYRGVGGVYADDRGTADGISIEEALSGARFRRDPATGWRHIGRLERSCRGAVPNRGHQVIAELERTMDRVWVLTQNVDGLHRRAGSRKVIEIHGSIHGLSCLGCGARQVVESYAGLALPPRCEACAAIIRPDVVLFGEMLPAVAVAELERELARGFDLVFSVGTSSLFPYIAAPMHLARRWGVPSVEINPEETDVSFLASHRLRLSARDALGAIFDAI